MRVSKNTKIGVIGLGYVGLPLALSFAKRYKTLGYDLSNKRICELNSGNDSTLEVSSNHILRSNISFTHKIENLRNSDFIIVTVPTPVYKSNKPNLQPLKKACKEIGNIVKKRACIIFESTVYPGCTEEICIPILEKESGLRANQDFFVGYSPERINPGDKRHTFEKINKVVSGSNTKSGKKIKSLYESIIKAEVFLASSIRVAEASKVLENTQRDINIALMNELSEICEKMNISTYDVLKAANTKWNFLDFRPGLVGGHCIGVDPYYLSYKANSEGVKPKMILSGRITNNRVSERIVQRFSSENDNQKLKITILGATFKENCPDFRNSGSLRVVSGFNKIGIIPTIIDPYLKKENPIEDFEYKTQDRLDDIKVKQDAILILVPHKEFLNLDTKLLKSKIKKSGKIFDMTNIYNQNDFLTL